MEQKKIANSLKQLNAQSDDVSKTDLFKICPSLLVEEEGFNTRGLYCEDYWERPDVREKLLQLAEAYKRGDYVPPIVVKVRDGKALVRDGHRRLRALNIAINTLGADIRKVEVLEHKGDEATQTLLIATSNEGAPLSVLERAEVYCRLNAWGWTDAEIATRTGKTQEHVRQLRRHMELPMDLKILIQKDVVAATYAQSLYDEHGNAAIDLINTATNSAQTSPTGKTKRVTKKHIRSPQPRFDKKTSMEMAIGMQRLTRKLDVMKSTPHSTYLLEIDHDELLMLEELRAKLAELLPNTPDTEGSMNSTQGSLEFDTEEIEGNELHAVAAA